MPVNWNAPIIAVPTPRGQKLGLKRFGAEVDRMFHRPDYRVPVKLKRNLWSNGGAAGTWYFDHDGNSVAGDDALYRIRNGLTAVNRGKQEG